MVNFDLGDDALLALEQKLKAELNPVQPDDKFISGLQDRLERTSLEQRQRTTALKLIMIAIGLTTGFAIFLIGRGFLRDHDKA